MSNLLCILFLQILAFGIAEKNWFLSANLAPEIGFHSPGKESRFFGLFWDQNVILVLIVLGSAIKYRRFDVILHFRHQYRSAVHQ